MSDLVKAVRDHARKNYNEDGWDYVVESFSDAEILEEIGDATTPAQAIKRVHRLVKLLREREEEIESTAW